MSDERQTPEDLTGADDKALGEALGSAIRGRVDAPTARPPVSSIAERAAAQAKARNTRRTVVGIAASVALVAGGIAAWNALDSDQSTEVIVVDESTLAPEPQATAQPTAAPTAPPVEEPQEAAPDRSQTGTESAFEPITPESVSTGPELGWVQFDPASVFGADAIDAHNIASVGDGRVLARVYGSNGDRVMVTGNGTDWTVVSMPPDFAPEHFNFAGERWVVTGWDVSTTEDNISAFFSDDKGATWTDLAIDIGGNADETVAVADVLVSGQNMVIAAKARVHADIASVIVGRGLVPDKESIKGWMSVEGDTVSFTRDESSDPESFELTAEEEDFLYGGDRSFARLYFSDGGAPELVAEYPASGVGGYGAVDGFHLAVIATEGELLFTSTDGRQWSQAPLTTDDGVPVGRFYSYYGTTEGTVWTSGQTSSQYRVERFDGVYSPALVAELPNGIATVDRLAVGPAGIAMSAAQGSTPDPSPIPVFQVAKDGYEFRYNDPVGGVSLWDLSEDVAIYVLDAENAQSNMLPEGIREVEGGDEGPDLLVFEDPETGEHLVSFTMEELEPWIDSDELMATADISTEQREQWVGWSADGTTWDWKTLSEAYGLTGLTDLEKGFTNIDLAVGSNFVIARVQPYSADPSDTPGDDSIKLSGLAPLWFIATVE